MYRVFFADKENNPDYTDIYESPVPADYVRKVKLQVDSVWMVSNWLNYVLIEAKEYPTALLKFPFIKNVEEVVPIQSVSLEVNLPSGEGRDLYYKVGEKDSVNPTTINEHRQWQLDTMGFAYFLEKKITGSGIVIAIIDAGFTMANQSKAFADIFSSKRVLKTFDFIDNDTDVYHGSNHGTAVWSCIAGNWPGKQTGLATGASFILLRSEDEKTETMADEDRWIQAIEMAYNLGADIVNSSVGFTNVLHSRDQLNGKTLISQAADIAAKKGMLVVVSAGNEWITLWKTLAVPADADGVITVGGIDKEGKHSYFSSVGPTADGRAKPDVVAPGTCAIVKGNDLVLANGTSFAAPLVTGYLACMLELNGKKNFTKDSLKFYCGLYPYFDYVFGYGVPYTVKQYPNIIFSLAYTVDKANCTLQETLLNHKYSKNIFLKIEDENGFIKFSRIINMPKSGKCKIPVSYKNTQFVYSKCYNPQETDKWTIWGNYFYYEY